MSQKLTDRLNIAAEKSRLRYMALMTIYTGTILGKITEADAEKRLREEGLWTEVEAADLRG